MTDTPTTENLDQITYWNDVAGAKWVANQTRLDRLMSPFTDALLAAAAPRVGERAVDVGCGCGDLALRLAAAIGPSGQVTAIDISRPMLSHAESRSRDAAIDARAPIEWLLADAMTHPFVTAADLMVSRFGVMFFEDRPRAFRNLRGALKPGGRFALMTWRRRSEVEWMQAPLEWISSVLPMPDDVPGEIGPFGLADETETRRMLAAAGFGEVTADPVDRPLTIGTSADEAFALLLDAGPVARLMRDAEPAQQRRAADVLRESLGQRANEQGIVLSGACWLYRGRA